MATIAIIGAGISGLVAAKALRDVGLSPRIFEASSSLGGIWSPTSPFLRQSMRVNASIHTCVLSDQTWSTSINGEAMYPPASAMGAYLAEYARKFIPPETISLNHRIIKVRRDGPGTAWSVSWESQDGVSEGTFDFLVIASGFFSRAYTPHIPGLDSFSGTVMHSSKYRSPESLKGKRVAIIGDSFSAAELAGDISPHTLSLTHVSPRPFWIAPRYIPLRAKESNSPFITMDLAFYKRSTRSSPGENPFPTIEQTQSKNAFFETLFGDQGRISSQLRVPLDEPSPIAISDSYVGAVRSGRVAIQRGRLASVENDELILDDGAHLKDQDVIIMATGFRPDLSFLPNELLEQMSYDPNDLHSPLLLHHTVFHPSLNNAAFVGMYRGPYMGVIELQSRWVAQVFSGVGNPSVDSQMAGIEIERRIREQVPRLQFPHADYVGLMHDLANELGLAPSLTKWPGRNVDVITPAQYGTGETANALIGQIEADLAASEKGKWVAAAIFSSWQGPWRISRRLESALSTYPSGTFTGTATFTLSADNPNEYAYLEQGELVTDMGMRLDARRRYKYVYDEAEDRIDAFFDDASDSGFFHSLRILAPGEEPPSGRSSVAPWIGEPRPGWRAVGDHLCIKDFYAATYWFTFSGVHLDEFRITYAVKGPSKDYFASATYTRP